MTQDIPGTTMFDGDQAQKGFALNRIDEEQAAQTYQYLLQIGALSEEDLAPDVSPPDPGGGTFSLRSS